MSGMSKKTSALGSGDWVYSRLESIILMTYCGLRMN
jgi:hypothetical protein